MKKILFIIMFILPVAVMAKQKVDDTPYLKGAVPMENGMVTFTKSFKIDGVKDSDIYQLMNGYITHSLIEMGTGDLRNRIVSEDQAQGEIIARVEEWMLFKKIKALVRDEVRFRYRFMCNVKDSKVTIRIDQISYLYNEDIDVDTNKPLGTGGEVYIAEGWIDDNAALNKAGNKLTRGSAKYRRKTVDRVNQIFNQVMDLFEDEAEAQQQKQQPKAPEVKKRKHITED